MQPRRFAKNSAGGAVAGRKHDLLIFQSYSADLRISSFSQTFPRPKTTPND
jgi:hypothetical protein